MCMFSIRFIAFIVGDFMYLNIDKLMLLADSLDNIAARLLKEKENIELECKRLSANQCLDDIIADLKRNAAALEEKAETAKRLHLSLLRICELYSSGEQRITEHIEGGNPGAKSAFVPESLLEKLNDVRWNIE